jgi:small subunit ribosomal protein S20
LANHKSAAKRARQTIKKTAVNTMARNSVKTSEKNVLKAIDKKDSQSIAELLRLFTKKISSAASKGILTKSAASRKVSRISKRVHTFLTAGK